jgi:Gametolysin peptidase M11
VFSTAGRTSDYTPRDAAFAALDIYQENVGITNLEEEVDHLMFCLPPGIPRFVASAVNSNPRSIYDDLNCARISVVMHELAHNMGLNHARKHGERYKDLTGYMGSSQRSMDGPLKCYNAAQHWKMGWYDDHTFTWDLNSLSHTATVVPPPQLIRLIPFVDYETLSKKNDTNNNPQQHYVLISLADELFLQFNLAWSFNEGTGDYEDKVVVVNGTDDNLIDGLDGTTHASMRIDNFHTGGADGVGGTHTLVVEVCSMTINKDNGGHLASIAVISVGLDGSACYTFSRESQVHGQTIATMSPTIPTISTPTSITNDDSAVNGDHIELPDSISMRIEGGESHSFNWYRWGSNPAFTTTARRPTRDKRLRSQPHPLTRRH